MTGRRLFVALIAAALATTALPAAAKTISLEIDTDAPSVGAGLYAGCDPLDPKACLLPFPNDLFTVVDRRTDTDRRVQISPLATPRNAAGVPINPSEWNHNDGFSPSTPILTYVPGVDLHETWGSAVDNIADLGRYQRSDAPMVIIDAKTGQRHPFWSELDTHPDTTNFERLLILRPAIQFLEGHRYIVALRNMKDSSGGVIDAGPAFAAYRDRTRRPGGAGRGFDLRRPHMNSLFASLKKAGVDRDDLFLAWDFTVASRRNLTERALHIRNESFAALGDRQLADNKITGRAPSYAVTKVEDFADGATMRHVEGTVAVPNYLSVQTELTVKFPEPIGDLGPALSDVFDQIPDEARDVLGAVPIDVEDIFENNLSVPGTHFYRLGSKNGMPTVDPLQPVVNVPFVCNIARGSDKTPSHPFLYGHGLLGSRSEANGSSTALRERGFSPCAVDWWGFSFADLPSVALALLDLSNIPGIMDRAQQGFLNFMVLGRAMAHPGGLATNAAFKTAAGKSLIRTSELFYDGNSQGAIMGGALTTLAPDFTRSVLGVPGMAYSTLLNRSVDWEGEYAIVYETAYPDPIDRQIGYTLIQMLWDRAESAGYAQHMTGNPLPNTPKHDVMLQVAFSDHQVANVAAEVEGRTIGAAMKTPVLPGRRHWSADPTWGFKTVKGNKAGVGSVLVYWFADANNLVTPPNGNVPPTVGRDPHGVPRQYGPATDQVVRFLLTGDLIDVCGGGPCVVPK